ncbi:MAG TPA: response regulator [Thermoanaerobaculia bacterium]|nr:response regulator [Thermoanaerobaculia bacterium]
MAEAEQILVVEDDLAIRRLLKMVLTREGFRVEEAADGTEAVTKLRQKEFDVIILDLMMPKLDGFEFLKLLAESEPSRLRRIIVTSAASPSVIRERLRGAPFDLLPKPFDIREIVERVRACIAQPSS